MGVYKLNISNENHDSPILTIDSNLSKQHVVSDNYQIEDRAEDLEFIGVTFIMMLLVLIPVNYFLK